MKLILITLTFALASLTLGSCQHRKATPVAAPTATYSSGYGAVK